MLTLTRLKFPPLFQMYEQVSRQLRFILVTVSTYLYPQPHTQRMYAVSTVPYVT